MNYMVELVWTASISCLLLFYFGEDISSIITKSCWLNQNVVGFFLVGGFFCFIVLLWLYVCGCFQQRHSSALGYLIVTQLLREPNCLWRLSGPLTSPE